jgi:hypothetical protein
LREKGSASSPSSGGRSAVDTTRRARETLCRASTSPGERAQDWSRRSRRPWRPRKRPGASRSSPSPRHGTEDPRGGCDGRARRRARPLSGRARRADVAGRRRLVRDPRGRDDRVLRRHWRQPRSRPRTVAGAIGHAADADDHGRPRVRRRVHAARRAGGRGAPDQRGPHVALRRGHPELESDLAEPRHPDSPGPVVGVARGDGCAPPGAVVPRVRHARHTGAPAAHGT